MVILQDVQQTVKSLQAVNHWTHIAAGSQAEHQHNEWTWENPGQQTHSSTHGINPGT